MGGGGGWGGEGGRGSCKGEEGDQLELEVLTTGTVVVL